MSLAGKKWEWNMKYLDLSDTWHRKTGWQCIWIASLWEISNQYDSIWTKYNLVIQKAVYLMARCTALWTIALCSRRCRCRWNARSERKYSKINLSLKVIHKWNVSSGNYKYSVVPSLVAILKYSIFNTSNLSCKGVLGICQGSAECLIR